MKIEPCATMHTNRLSVVVLLLATLAMCSESPKPTHHYSWSNGWNSEMIQLFENGVFEYSINSDLIILDEGYLTTHYSGKYVQKDSILIFTVDLEHRSKNVLGLFSIFETKTITKTDHFNLPDTLVLMRYKSHDFLIPNFSQMPLAEYSRSSLDSALLAKEWNRPKGIFVSN